MAKRKKMPGVVLKAALAVECPHCKSGPGDRCRKTSRSIPQVISSLDEPHTKRVVKAFEEGILSVKEKRS